MYTPTRELETEAEDRAERVLAELKDKYGLVDVPSTLMHMTINRELDLKVNIDHTPKHRKWITRVPIFLISIREEHGPDVLRRRWLLMEHASIAKGVRVVSLKIEELISKKPGGKYWLRNRKHWLHKNKGGEK